MNTKTRICMSISRVSRGDDGLEVVAMIEEGCKPIFIRNIDGGVVGYLLIDDQGWGRIELLDLVIMPKYRKSPTVWENLYQEIRALAPKKIMADCVGTAGRILQRILIREGWEVTAVTHSAGIVIRGTTAYRCG